MDDDLLVTNGTMQRKSPVDLHALPTVDVTPPDGVRAAVARAKAAQADWEKVGFGTRVKRVRQACKAMLARRDEVVAIMLEEIGKHPAEVLMSEALGPLDFFNGWENVLKPVARAQKLALSPIAFPGKKGYVEHAPRGVVGIIAPWNFPLAYFFKPVFPALLLGNTVVIKSSEYSPRTAAWFVGVLAEFLPRDVIQTVTGPGETGQQLIAAGIDSLVFTGSIPTGKLVARAAADAMIPCSVELGGKDAAIVLDDCDLPRTIAGVMYGAISNAGQSCGSIERVYVLDAIADEFVGTLADAVGRLTYGPRQDGLVDVGPIVNPRQLALIESHVADAVAKGARVLCGGKRLGKGFWFAPTVLDRCDASMKVVTDETFGPVIAVIRVASVDDAVAQANDSIYGLNASVWSRDLKRAEQVARRLEVGTAFVNNHAFTGASPAVPWSGVKQTGHGVANSTFALGAFSRPRVVVLDGNAQPDAWWFPVDATLADLGNRLANAQLGKVLGAIKVPFILRERAKTILAFTRPRGSASARPTSNGAGDVSKQNGYHAAGEA